MTINAATAYLLLDKAFQKADKGTLREAKVMLEKEQSELEQAEQNPDFSLHQYQETHPSDGRADLLRHVREASQTAAGGGIIGSLMRSAFYDMGLIRTHDELTLAHTELHQKDVDAILADLKKETGLSDAQIHALLEEASKELTNNESSLQSN